MDCQNILIVGGGIAGMTAAIRFAGWCNGRADRY